MSSRLAKSAISILNLEYFIILIMIINMYGDIPIC